MATIMFSMGENNDGIHKIEKSVVFFLYHLNRNAEDITGIYFM